MQRQIMRETRRRMQQHGKIRIPVFPIPEGQRDLYCENSIQIYLIHPFVVLKEIRKRLIDYPVAAACVQLGIQTTQGHRGRQHGGERRGGPGRWDAGYHRGLQRLVRERSVRRCLQVGLHRRCLQRKGKPFFPTCFLPLTLNPSMTVAKQHLYLNNTERDFWIRKQDCRKLWILKNGLYLRIIE